jgi:hypothetical protein
MTFCKFNPCDRGLLAWIAFGGASGRHRLNNFKRKITVVIVIDANPNRKIISTPLQRPGETL